MKGIRSIAYLAAGSAYLLIVLGGVVRITGSGMGCGDHWPLCNGHLIPPLDDIGTLIEYGHRLMAAAVGMLVGLLVVVSFQQRSRPGVAGRGGVLRVSVLAGLLLAAQVLLGAVTVILELPPTAVVLHLGTAMALIAVLLVAGLRSGTQRNPTPGAGGDRPNRRGAVVALGLGGASVLLGALTANLGAGGACLGFPLCNGQVWPTASAGGLAHIHWTHRLVAYALTVHLVMMAAGMRRRGVVGPLRRLVNIALGLTLTQVAVAAAMILTILQPHWRALHVAAGTAVWVSLVILTWCARSQSPVAPAAESSPDPVADSLHPRRA